MNPLSAPAPTEIPLANAPLAKVIAQLRFPEVLAVEAPETAAKFQAAIGHTYGFLSREQGFSGPFLLGVPVQLGVPIQTRAMTHWRFADAPNVDWQWRVTLTSQFLTLEVARYTSRTEFFQRFEMLLEALQVLVKPTMTLRLGVRYVNRIVFTERAEIATLVRPEIAGMLVTDMSAHVGHMQCETLVAVKEEACQIAVRCGVVPADALVEGLEAPFGKDWFLLDFDVFDDKAGNFDAQATAARAKAFAQRSYGFFRWAVTDEFLRRYGGQQ
ncbi:TIGR04255 family protein [Piscinibacter sp.]|uniref:TIGR04255 family protein n=1 Tax=Piscinibacter sp. TaxID=1903157 RepID=UPI00355AA715